MRWLLVGLIALMCFSCSSDLEISPSAATEPSFPNVDARLWSYYETFEEEARFRGKIIDLAGLEITGAIAELHPDGVAGVCHFSSAQPNEVEIDASFWANASDLLREMVVFHELGHCVLGRGHDESTLQNGYCASIMRSGVGECRDAYTTASREYYLDELFEIVVNI